MSEVTRILNAVQQGDPKAAEELIPLVYEEIRKLAAHKMANEAPGQTLQPTALVHAAWLRLVGHDEPARFQNRAYFFGAAAEAMRRILIERARRKKAGPLKLRKARSLPRSHRPRAQARSSAVTSCWKE